ncbi:SurA N-terminal domain-containing protein [Treponema sp.]|uniref:MOSP complex formation periplasmic protein, TDE1658 family n=1 Tax=Treponema sp. TaxID=166 RepID=UPI00298E89C5|nr:SurA N-terminal domain-containing protein [Treponema sp.]MCR5612623.1 SurA N-terminal domain-containing protein [Treponema sp.]
MKRLLCATFLSVAALFSMTAQANLQPLVVVKLNGTETISLKDLKDTVETYQSQAGRKFTVEEKKQLLESLIDQKLIVQAAKKEGITFSDSQIDQYYLANMSQMVGRQVTEKEFADIIRQTQNKTVDEFLVSQVRMNVAQYKAYLRNQLTAQQYVLTKKQAEINAVQPTDKEIRDFYELNKSKLVWNDMVHMFLISVQKGSDAAAAKAKIQKMISDYTAGKLTIEAMREAMKNPAAAGYVAGDMMVEKTEQYAQVLGVPYERVLQIFQEPLKKASDLKETDADYQFYILLEKYNAKMLGISDIIQPGSTLTVYEYIKQNLTNQKRSLALIKAVQDLSTELNTPANVERKKTGAELDKLLNW